MDRVVVAVSIRRGVHAHVVVWRAEVGEAELLVGLNVPAGEDCEESLVQVALVDVAGDDDAVRVAAVVLWAVSAMTKCI